MFILLCSSSHSTSEMKMEDILSVLTRDDSFQARRGGGQVSFTVYCLLLTDVTHSPLG